MSFVVVKVARHALGCLGLIVAACGSQAAPAEMTLSAQGLAAAPTPPHTVPADSQPAAPALAAQAHASCGQGAACACAGASKQGEASDEHGSCGSCGSGESHGAACGNAQQPAPPAAADATLEAASEQQLTRIADPSQVCMVRDHFMGRPQLSVSTANGTYYGCCAGCANRLLQDPNARVAIDPVSHHPVDKAVAVLAKTARGRVLYFENEQTLSAFRAGLN